ncbi:MAG: glycosyltransferase family 4 protein [Patescibacteria group bacterium]
MKILTIGLDATVLDKNSPLNERFKLYGELTNRHDIVVPTPCSSETPITDKVMVYSIKKTNKFSDFFSILSLAKKIIKKNGYDLITTRDPYFLGLLALYLSRRNSLGLEIQVHGFEKLNPIRKAVARFVLKRADGIRVVSNRLKKDLIKNFNIKEEVITVVPIFVDCAETKAKAVATAARLEQDEDLTFVTASRLVPIKNIPLQIEAMKEVLRAYPNTTLMILGEGIEKNNLVSLVERLGLKDSVLFEGFVSDVTVFFARSDCFLLTSNAEGYGLAPIVAACFGLPVIMTDVGCAGEVIVDKENGLVIPINNKDALVNAMIEMIKNKDFRKIVKENNNKMCNKLLSLDETLNEYLKSWQGIMTRKADKTKA